MQRVPASGRQLCYPMSGASLGIACRADRRRPKSRYWAKRPFRGAPRILLLTLWCMGSRRQEESAVKISALLRTFLGRSRAVILAGRSPSTTTSRGTRPSFGTCSQGDGSPCDPKPQAGQRRRVFLFKNTTRTIERSDFSLSFVPGTAARVVLGQTTHITGAADF